MKLYSENKSYKLYHGNMLDMLDVIEPNSIDSIVTDPPYEIGFMNKKWDDSGIAFQKETWEKCLQVLKPGGYLLSFASPRTQHRIACAIEDAGFEIRDTIMWLYGCGFPKNTDISKQIDKKPQADKTIEFKKWLKTKLDMCGKSYKQINEECEFTATSYCKTDFKDYWSTNHPTKEKWQKMKSVIGITETDYDWVCENNIEERGYVNPTGGLHGGTGCTVGKFTGKQLSNNAISENAKKWAGWGTALKPAYEPIILARKPIKGTIARNCLIWGVGGLNIDECRVPAKQGEYDIRHYTNEDCFQNNKPKESQFIVEKQPDGRFPANLIHDGSEEATRFFPQRGSGNGGEPYNYAGTEYDNSDTSMFNGDKPQANSNYNDSGSAARYFMNCAYTEDDFLEEPQRYYYCSKANKNDRNSGLIDFEFKTVDDGRKKSIDNPYQRGKTQRLNTHPTVKPCELIRYLIRLVTPNDGTVLDPFNGSGSTGKAVMRENLINNKNYKYIGIELTDEYLPISVARIEHASIYKEDKLSDKVDFMNKKNKSVNSDSDTVELW